MEGYGTAALLAALFNITVGMWIFKENPRSKIAKRFFIATILLAVWGAAEALAQFAPTEQMSLLWMKLSHVSFFVFPAVLFYIVHHISGGRWRILYHASIILYIVFIPFLFTTFFIQETAITAYGYNPVYGWLFPWFAFAHVSMIALGAVLLYQEGMKLEVRKVHYINLMISILFIPVIPIYLLELGSPLFGWGLPKIGSVFSLFIVLASRHAYRQYSYAIFPKPQTQATTKDAVCGALCSVCPSFYAGRCESCAQGEKEKKEKCKIYVCAKTHETSCPTCGHILTCQIYRDHREGCPFLDSAKVLPSNVSYRVESVDYTTGRKIFRDRIIQGDFGLIISREHPDIFFSTWDLERLPLIWLSLEKETKWTINPTSLAKLGHIMSNFIKEVPFSCILFEGVEYLVIHNTFDVIMKLVYSIDDEVVRNKCRFILSYDPRTFDKNRLAVLERELKPIPESYVIDG